MKVYWNLQGVNVRFRYRKDRMEVHTSEIRSSKDHEMQKVEQQVHLQQCCSFWFVLGELIFLHWDGMFWRR